MKRTKKKNPLNKRVPRELKQDIGKYLALLLFLTLTIGFVSGFLVIVRNAIREKNRA